MKNKNIEILLSRLQSGIHKADECETMDVHWNESDQKVELNDLTSNFINEFLSIVYEESAFIARSTQQHLARTSTDIELNWKFSHELWGDVNGYWVRTIISIPLSDVTPVIYALEVYTNKEESIND
jgi:hypothetical protein